MSERSISGLERPHLKYVWGACFVVVAVFSAGITPWDALGQMVANDGVGEEQAQLLVVVAGYTLPLAAGTAIVTAITLLGGLRDVEPIWRAAVAAGILFVAGLASRWLGLGLAPATMRPIAGPVYISWPAMVADTYLNAYGWPLAISAVAIGAATGVTVDVMYRKSTDTENG